MNMKASVLSTLLGLVITTGPTFGQSSKAKAFRVSCSSFEGVRVHFVTHPAARAADRNRLMREEDAISGLNMDLTFSTADIEGNVTTYGNVNVGGGVTSFRVVRLTGSALLSFVGHDPNDGSTNLLSLFPGTSAVAVCCCSDSRSS
jgi:hypothetical protein